MALWKISMIPIEYSKGRPRPSRLSGNVDDLQIQSAVLFAAFVPSGLDHAHALETTNFGQGKSGYAGDVFFRHGRVLQGQFIRLGQGQAHFEIQVVEFTGVQHPFDHFQGKKFFLLELLYQLDTFDAGRVVVGHGSPGFNRFGQESFVEIVLDGRRRYAGLSGQLAYFEAFFGGRRHGSPLKVGSSTSKSMR
jgi:hypothetical protein